MILSGRATPEGTERFFSRRNFRNEGYIAETWYARIPAHLYVSRLGMGTYRMAVTNREHFDALREALLYGINVIDTASNFADGKSRQLVGTVLRELAEAGRLKRDEIIVISKAGLLEGKLLHSAQKASYSTTYLNERQSYSLDPEFLKGQIAENLKAMQLEALDFFLIQNPEKLLKAGVEKEKLLEELHLAFQTLESQVKARFISYYGLCLGDSIFFERVSPADILKIAGPHFMLLQYPRNLLENELHIFGQGALQKAGRQKQLWLLSHRPLNAAGPNGQLLRLCVPTREAEEASKEFEKLLLRARELEERLEEQAAPANFKFTQRSPSFSQLAVAFKDSFSSTYHFRTNAAALINQLQQTVNLLAARLGPSCFELIAYKELCNKLFNHWDAHYTQVEAAFTRPLGELLGLNYEGLLHRPLPVQVISLLLADPAPQTILCGMRRVSYVRQITDVFKIVPPLENKNAFALVQQLLHELQAAGAMG